MHVFAPKASRCKSLLCSSCSTRHMWQHVAVQAVGKFHPTWTEEQLKKLKGKNSEKLAADDVCGVLTWEWAATPFSALFSPTLVGPTAAAFCDGIQVWVRLQPDAMQLATCAPERWVMFLLRWRR